MNSNSEKSLKSNSEEDMTTSNFNSENLKTYSSAIYLPDQSTIRYKSLNGKRKQHFEIEMRTNKVIKLSNDTDTSDNILIADGSTDEDVNLVDPLLTNELNYMDHDYISLGTPLEETIYFDTGSPTSSISTRSRISREEDDVFIQQENCTDTADYLPACRECANIPKTSKFCCRFYEFRKLKNTDGTLTVYGFLDPHLDPNEYDIKLWETASKDEHSPHLDTDSIKYLLSYIAAQFCELIEEERDACKQHLSEDTVVAWKRSVQGVREMCDVCETTLFNYHWTCTHCGFSVCLDCYKERKNFFIRTRPHNEQERKLRDNFFWYKCTNKEDHDIRELMLTQIIVGDALELINKRLHEICQQWNVSQSCGCLFNRNCIKKESTSSLHDYQSKYSQQFMLRRRQDRIAATSNDRKGIDPKESKILYPSVPHEWLCDGKVLRFLNPLATEEAYRMFQDQWELGLPILISNCTNSMSKQIWHPQTFLTRFGNRKNLLVNCVTGEQIQNQQMARFWEGFMEIRNRLRDKKTNEPMVLKLKDWPPTEDFAELIPEHFADLMECLPLPAYTSRNGKFNLASHLPSHFVKPDLGPKMYSAYGQATFNSKGSTNLHLDISDAINVMVYVSVPVDIETNSVDKKATDGYKSLMLINAINDADCDFASRCRYHDEKCKYQSDKTKKLPGAFWHIYDSKDADKIRELLIAIAKEQNKSLEDNTDPIHDQSTYLDLRIRNRLMKEHKVKGYSFIQFDGDAVFIPAGTPHQVRNINDCIKVAEDFVSPENISQCFNLTEEFRDLSQTHTNHEDKLQVKNLLYHTVKNILSYFDNSIE